MAFVEGFVDDLALCKINIVVQGWAEPIEITVDTGFNRTLWLPRHIVQRAGRQLMWENDEVYTAGDDTPANKPVGVVSIEWMGRIREVITYFSDRGERDETLLGTELLSDSLLEINFPRRYLRITQ